MEEQTKEDSYVIVSLDEPVNSATVEASTVKCLDFSTIIIDISFHYYSLIHNAIHCGLTRLNLMLLYF